MEIPTGRRTWAMAAHGRLLYLGMWGQDPGQGNFYRLDTDRMRVEALPTVRNTQEFWALAVADDGVVYAGTDRAGAVAIYDPRTNRLGDLIYHPRPGHVTALAVEGMTVYAGAGRRETGLVAIHRATADFRNILPPELAGPVGVYDLATTDDLIVAATQSEPARIAVMQRGDPSRYEIIQPDGEAILGAIVIDDERVFASGMRSGRLYAYDRSTRDVEMVATPVANVPVRQAFRTDSGILGVSAPGLVWEHDLSSGDTEITDLLTAGAPGGPERAQSLAVGRSHFAVGTNNAIELHDLAGGASRGRVVVPGEPKAMIAVGEAFYLAMYPNGDLWRVDPEQGQAREVADWVDIQNRPRAMAYDPRHRRFLIATLSDFAGGGALVVHEEEGEVLRVHTDPLGDRQPVESVTYFEGQAIIGGRGTDARLAALDPATGRRAWELVPSPGSGSITGLVLHGRHIYVLTGDGRLTVVDARSREIIRRMDVLDSAAGELAVAARHVWAVGTDELVQIAPGTFQRRTVADGLAMRALTRPHVRADDRGRVYVLSGSDVVRVTA